MPRTASAATVEAWALRAVSAAPTPINATGEYDFIGGALHADGPDRTHTEVSVASVPELLCILAGRERKRLGSRRSRSCTEEDETEQSARSPWIGRLWRCCYSWMVSAFILFIAAGRARAVEQREFDVDRPVNKADPSLPPTPYFTVSRRLVQEGSPNSGAYDAPRVRRPYWESPNIIIEEADEYPHPSSLEVDDPDSFWYTLRPNILNIPVQDEWDFYNLINTDRPDFTDAVYSVGKGVAYLETGYTFNKINDATSHISTRQLPESLLRYGVTDEFELRVKWNGYLMTDYRDLNTGAHLTQFGGEDLDLGFKWELIQQKGWRPMFTVVSGMVVPTGTRGVSANAVEPHVNLVYGWGLRRWLYLKGMTGVDFLRVSNAPVSEIGSVVPGFVIQRASQASWHQSFCFLTQWSKHIGAFHEWFLIQNTGAGDTRAQNYCDMGTYIYLTPNIQLDARIGTRLSNHVDQTFTGVGFSARW
ncbi:MAG TPA: transporter [Pirellulales bacterium]|jgi:hypothetical protein|nr:transporter [Pirellulales bacterium]